MAKPLSLQHTPVHRWFVFPHSYSANLVEKIIEEWGLSPGNRILDPFVGAGTTLVTARQRAIPCVGLDVSSLSVLVSRVKTTDYDPGELVAAWQRVRKHMPKSPPMVLPHDAPLIRRAFTQSAWSWLIALLNGILSLSSQTHREFFRVAYLRAMREVCRAVSDGGWLRWTRRRPSGRDLVERMDRIVAMMLADLKMQSIKARTQASCEVRQGDARFPPDDLGKFSAVICSPPYPNRHDYSRVFAPELLLAFCNEEELKQSRYRSFRSHVEAREPANQVNGYAPPPQLTRTLRQLAKAPLTDRRVLRMIDGYFQDCFLLLKALRSHLQEGAHLAFVVGNVRHAGVMVGVDEYLGQIAESLAYLRQDSWVIRYRGNSAQQMGQFGRTPARESVVMLKWSQS